MKKSVLLIAILVGACLNAIAQDIGKIEYKIKLDGEFINQEKLEKKKKLSFINNALNEHTEQFKFSLVFNKEESIFNVEEQMTSDHNSRDFRIAKALIGASRVYYLNTKSNLSLNQFNAYGQDIIIKDSISNIKWALTKESKVIDGYTCYKANTEKIVINSKGTFKTNVIAWYTPDLNYNFGPKGYAGLPGMILELNDNKFIYYAFKINLNMANQIKIDKPKKGKIMTKSEFTELENNIDNTFGQK
ncbi:GLPGLI family protein [Winogradskyella pacifica]|uniref:GLPGLI family protein n=1 Tax=Winogradskyella pacifica TaxID=664642 RepID=A0A3D9N4V2_9FLAO|nr:GLPGLI family protein [Winogradskyella pacifica]REE27808.1 GLPGLI family protein [Winogradskyella pacifica]